MSRPLPYLEANSFSPPLMMKRSDVDEAVALFGKALDAVTPDMEKAAGVKAA